MDSTSFTIWIVVTIMMLHSTSTASPIFPDRLTKFLARYRSMSHRRNRPKRTTTSTTPRDLNLEELAILLKKDDLDSTPTLDLLRKAISVKPRNDLQFKEENRHAALEALKQIVRMKEIEKGKEFDKNHRRINAVFKLVVDSIAASEIASNVMSKQRLLRSAKHGRGKEFRITLNEEKKSRSKRSAKLNDDIINKRIEASNKGRDLVLEAVRQLIESEKTRKRFDLVNPKNSKFSKRQQLLWDRLRIKAAEELLIHPKPLYQSPTERIFDNFKIDLEYETPEPTLEPGLFSDFKKRVEKQYYLDQLERGRGRVFMSTLKPYE